MKKETILIATGVYPPEIGGPAMYAKNIKDAWEAQEKRVLIATFGFERKLPTGVRHLYFLLRNIFKVIKSDFIIVLDTWSVAFPIAVTCLILNKKFVVRTGGDFLWESYVERTKKKVLFRLFYEEERKNFSLKEKVIFNVTKWILKRSNKIIFSTNWQKEIWAPYYTFEDKKTVIVENCYEKKSFEESVVNKKFIGSVRNLVWKNTDMLRQSFGESGLSEQGFTLDLQNYPYDKFLEQIKYSYVVILVSLGDISPNMILDAIKFNKPFICTKECGIYERIKEIGIWVDPLDVSDIREKMLWLSEPVNYASQKEKVAKFNFTHSWQEISKEILLLKQ